MTSNTPGAYCRFRFTGPSLKVNLSSPSFTGSSLRIRTIVDDVETYNSAVASGTSQVTLASGLADATHTAWVWYDANDPTQDVWANSPPVMSCRITGFEVATGKTVSAVTPRPKRMLWIGDSVSYGISVLRSTSSPAGHAGSLAPGVAVAQTFDCEIGIVGFGSTGYGKSGLGSAPRAFDPEAPTAGLWRNYWSGQSRLDGANLLSPAPDYIVCYHGTADYTGNASDSNVTAGVQGLIPALRAAAPDAKIFMIVPANRQKLSAITAGFEAALTSKVLVGVTGQVTVWKGQTDPNCFLMDLGPELAQGLATSVPGGTAASVDGYHPDTAANGRISAAQVAGMRLALSGAVAITSAVNVRQGTDRGDGVLGTLAVPTANQVLAGISVDATSGTVTQPAPIDVRAGEKYGAAGTQYTGTLEPGGGSYPTADEIAVKVLQMAAAAPIAANVRAVNDVPLQGVGTADSPWGPA